MRERVIALSDKLWRKDPLPCYLAESPEQYKKAMYEYLMANSSLPKDVTHLNRQGTALIQDLSAGVQALDRLYFTPVIQALSAVAPLNTRVARRLERTDELSVDVRFELLAGSRKLADLAIIKVFEPGMLRKEDFAPGAAATLSELETLKRRAQNASKKTLLRDNALHMSQRVHEHADEVRDIALCDFGAWVLFHFEEEAVRSTFYKGDKNAGELAFYFIARPLVRYKKDHSLE